MKRIALFAPVLNGGGAERMLRHLGAEFVRRGHHCDLIVATDNGPPLEAPPLGIDIIRLQQRNSRRAIPRLVTYLHRNKPDVLMSTVFSANVAAIVAAKLSLTDVRMVVREASRTDAQLKTHSFWRRSIDLLLRRVIYPQADFFVAVSEDVRSHLLESGIATHDKCRVIHNPMTRPSFEGARTLPEQDLPELLACGRLELQKDYPTLLRAFAVVLQERKARLTILGGGALRSELESLAKELGIFSQVSFEGFVEDTSPFLRRADVFVHTATYEGFPSAILEAVLSGCQVVATDAPGGASEILQGGGLGSLVPIGDHEAVGAAILRILSGKDKYSLPPDYARHFSLEAVAEQYLEVLLPATHP